MKKLFLLGFCGVILLVFVVYLAAAGVAIWTDNFNRAGVAGPDVAQAVTVSGNRIYASGFSQSADGVNAFTVRAYNAANGGLLWGSYFSQDDMIGGSAYAITTESDWVFAAGWTKTVGGGEAFTVNAYDADTGAIRWTNSFDRKLDGSDRANAIAVSNKRVFAVGYTWTPNGDWAFTVRAYDWGNGDLLWADYYDPDGANIDSATAVTVSGDTVIAVGQTESNANWKAFTVRAYNAATGAVRWTNRFDRVIGMWYDEAKAVTVSGNIVYTAGITSKAGPGNTFTVRAYDLANGNCLWSDFYDRDLWCPGEYDSANALVVSGERLFAAGASYKESVGASFTVRAYNAANGIVLWTNCFDREGTVLWDEAYSIGVNNSGVFAAGFTRKQGAGDSFTVRAYNPDIGNALWTNFYDREGDGTDKANDIAVNDSGVVAAGYTSKIAFGWDFTVRSYTF